MDEGQTALHRECELMEFLESVDPYQYLTGYNKFNLDQKSKDAIEHFGKEIKAPKELDIISQDLKVLGRREFQHLLRMRHQYQFLLKKQERAAKEASRPQKEEREKTEEELEAELEKELDATISRMDAEKKRKEKKERLVNKKTEQLNKMSYIQPTLENDEDLTLPRHVWDEWRTKGYEKIGEKSSDSEQSSEEESSEEDAKESSEESIDAEIMAVEEMAD